MTVRRQCPGPHPHQQVLHDRQLVRIASHGVQDLVDQGRLDPAAEDRGGTFDGLPALLPREARRQELPVVERLRKAGEDRALAQVLRPQAEDDEHLVRSLRRTSEEECDEGFGFVASALRAIAEDFLELIDQHQHAVAVGELVLPEDLHQTEWPAPQRVLDEGDAVTVAVVPSGDSFVQRFGQPSDRSIAGPHLDDAPLHTRLGEESALERGDHAGTEQRGLATAGDADDAQEPGSSEPPQQLVGELLAAEEDVRLLATERPEARIGRDRPVLDEGIRCRAIAGTVARRERGRPGALHRRQWSWATNARKASSSIRALPSIMRWFSSSKLIGVFSGGGGGGP